MKDRKGQVIGFEKLNFIPLGTDMPLVTFETMDTPIRWKRRPPLSILEKRNSMLGMEFDRYLREHSEFTDKIPDNAQVILLLEGDEAFNTWSARIGKEQAAQHQPLLYRDHQKTRPGLFANWGA
jgi:hypothetical protein